MLREIRIGEENWAHPSQKNCLLHGEKILYDGNKTEVIPIFFRGGLPCPYKDRRFALALYC